MKISESEFSSLARNCDEYAGDLWGIYRIIKEDEFPTLQREQHTEIFFHFLRHALENRVFLLKEDPDFIRHLNKVYSPEKHYPLPAPESPEEFERFYRLFWPDFDDPEYETEVLIVLEAGGRIWWMRDGAPGEWFLGYPGNKTRSSSP